MPGAATAEDLVDRVFARSRPNQLWVTAIPEHPTREGKVYCAVVVDAFSRRVVGWSISRSPDASEAPHDTLCMTRARPSSCHVSSTSRTR